MKCYICSGYVLVTYMSCFNASIILPGSGPSTDHATWKMMMGTFRWQQTLAQVGYLCANKSTQGVGKQQLPPAQANATSGQSGGTRNHHTAMSCDTGHLHQSVAPHWGSCVCGSVPKSNMLVWAMVPTSATQWLQVSGTASNKQLKKCKRGNAMHCSAYSLANIEKRRSSDPTMQHEECQ